MQPVKKVRVSTNCRHLVIQDNGICFYYSEGDYVCRACLSQLGADADQCFFTEQSKLLYTSFTTIKMESGDGLPEFLCKNCSEKLTDFHVFWTTCKKSYNAMQEAIQSATNEDRTMVRKHEEVHTFSDNLSVEVAPMDLLCDCATESDDGEWAIDDCENFDSIDNMNTVTGSRYLRSSKEETLDITNTANKLRNTQKLNKKASRVKSHQANNDKNSKKAIVRKSIAKTAKQKRRVTICPVCNKEIVTKTFSRHMKLLHNIKTDKVRNCPVCKKEITSKNLSRHMQVMHEDVNTEKVTNLQEDIDKVRNIQEAFKEKVRIMKGLKKEKVRKHANVNTEKASTCPVCTREIVGDLTKHLQKHDTVKFYCKICKKDFYSAYHFKKHDKNNYVLCQVCGKSIFNAHYAYHLKYHNKEKNHACATCGQKFYTPGLLRAHELDRHMGRQYICDYCNKVFVTKLAIRNHIYRHQTPRFKCSICEKAYRSHWMLYMHKRDHAGIKPYKCDFCQRGFQTKGRMKKHRVMHTGERNYNCLHCHQTFAYSTSCRRHEARCKLGKEKLNVDTGWNIPMPMV